jgi:hypothetical protein
MNRDEALKLLKGGKEGVAEWNRRRDSGEEIPDLGGADLHEADLRTADRRGVNLSGVNLSGANLSEADFRAERRHGANPGGADLSGADLSGANLMWANLIWADFHGADLHAANLYAANLNGADLSGADLSGADLSGATFLKANFNGTELSRSVCWLTGFADVDLSNAKGLDSVVHLAPSTIGTDTLYKSRGKLPEVFLRGCGLHEGLIKFLPSIIGSMNLMQFYSCFISHSTKDQAFADRLHSRMVQEKLRVWYAPENMRGGRRILDQIEGAIRDQDKLLLVLSESSMQSGWVEMELRKALRREQAEKRQVLFPIRITSWEPVRDWKCFDSDTGKDLANLVREFHIPDFSRWKDHDSFEAAFARLLDDLRASE